MLVTLNYGKNGLPIDFPEEWEVDLIEKKKMPVLRDPIAGVLEALSHPVGSKPLTLEAKECRNACILICDITRPVPNGVILPVLIRELLTAGLSPDSITVIVATGLHRPNEGEELRELVGDDWVLNTVKVVNHYARIDEDHVDLGTSTRGTRIKLDRRFVHADFRLAIGLVEPHFMAGYSGGRKVILPGIAYQDTIRAFHKAAFLEHPRAKNCVLKDNPLHQEQLETTEMMGRTLAINAVIDENRSVSYLNFGEIKASHLEAVDFADRFSRLSVPQKFATVVTSGGGYPLDKTYYQTIKGMVGAMEILAPGGQLVIASECSEGMGSPEFLEAQSRLLKLGNKKFLANILAKSHAAIDEWQTEMLLKPMRIGKIHLFSNCLDFTDRQMTGVHVLESIDRTVRKCVEGSGKKRVAVIPEGPYVIPTCDPANDSKGSDEKN